jgi:hypothetical protein
MNTKKAVSLLLQKGHLIEGRKFAGTGFIVQHCHEDGLWVLPAVPAGEVQNPQQTARTAISTEQTGGDAEAGNEAAGMMMRYEDIDWLRFASQANPDLYFQVVDYDQTNNETKLNMAVQIFGLSDETLTVLTGRTVSYLDLTVDDWHTVLIAMAGL